MIIAHYVDDGPDGNCGGACDYLTWDKAMVFASKADMDSVSARMTDGWQGRRRPRIVEYWDAEDVVTFGVKWTETSACV